MRPLVLFAIPELAAGGPDRVMAELMRDLPRDRFRLALAVSRTGGRYFDALPGDVDVQVVDDRRYPIRAFARLVDALKPDLVMTTLRMNLTAQCATWLQRHRPVLVVRQANAIAADFASLKRRSLVKHRLAHWLVVRGFARADGVVAQSRDMADELLPSLGRNQLLVTIGNPIDIAATRQLARAQAASAAVRLPGTPALVGVGRLASQKGFDLLIAALPAILAAHPTAALTLIGSGDERATLEATATALGVAAHVHFAGQRSDALAVLAAADLFVSASRYEGFSNAILEAMALGTPVAATPCPGATREMIRDGETGTLASATTATAISAAVLRALAADKARLAEAATRHVGSNYAPSVIVDAYTRMFEQLLGARQDAARRP